MKKPANQMEQVLVPSKVMKKIRQLARKSRRDEAGCLAVCLEFGSSHIEDRPFFYAGLQHIKD